jgi:hypothetical protein
VAEVGSVTLIEAAEAAASASVPLAGRWRPMSTAMRTPAALNTAITQDAVPRPAESASDADFPAALLDAVTEL